MRLVTAAPSIDSVRAAVERLRATVFRCSPDSSPIPATVDAMFDSYHRDLMPGFGGWETWLGLAPAEQAGVLLREVDWAGLSEDHRNQIIGRVIRGEDLATLEAAEEPADIYECEGAGDGREA